MLPAATRAGQAAIEVGRRPPVAFAQRAGHCAEVADDGPPTKTIRSRRAPQIGGSAFAAIVPVPRSRATRASRRVMYSVAPTTIAAPIAV